MLHGVAQNVRHEPLHGIAWSSSSSIASCTWVHVTARQFPVHYILHIFPTSRHAIEDYIYNLIKEIHKTLSVLPAMEVR